MTRRTRLKKRIRNSPIRQAKQAKNRNNRLMLAMLRRALGGKK